MNQIMKMNLWGIGLQLFISSIIYTTIILVLDRLVFGSHRLVLISPLLNYIFGLMLCCVGIVILFFAFTKIRKAVKEKKLITTGIYSLMRHPIYSAWILFIVPGIVIINGQILGLTIPVVMYIIFLNLIKKEENVLINLFGNDYLAYKKKVPAIIPTLYIP